MKHFTIVSTLKNIVRSRQIIVKQKRGGRAMVQVHHIKNISLRIDTHFLFFKLIQLIPASKFTPIYKEMLTTQYHTEASVR